MEKDWEYCGCEVGGRFFLGPMAAYTDIAYRMLCRESGAAMCFTEFSNAEGIVRGLPESLRLMKTCRKEMPVGIQIFGSNEKSMAQAVRIINRQVKDGGLCASCIDINFGCPSGSVVRAGAGSALLRKPEKMAAIARACVEASELPISAKIRAGWSKDDSLALALSLEKAGVAGLTIHWRTAIEGRGRQGGWGGLRHVKEALSIPLIGNGGAATPELAVKFLLESGCDAVMISSSALGNPGIFQAANALLEGKAPEPSVWEKKLHWFRRYRLLAEAWGVLSEKRLRLHAQEFLTGHRGVKDARKMLNGAKTIGEIAGIMENFSPAPSAPLGCAKAD